MAVTDESGNVVERMAYDPFGKRRFVTGADDPNNTITGQTTEHGYTEEEMLDSVGVINLNGRMYDPLLARFVSADPNIQSPYNLQSYNRYSYAWNNPLIGIDPSGYLFDSLVDVPFIDNAWNNHIKPALPTIAAIGVNFVPGLNMYASGFLSGIISSNGNLQAGIVGALTAGAFDFVGNMGLVQGSFESVLAHGFVGGASSALMGGDFRSGFLAAGFTQALAPTINGIDRSTIGPSLERTTVAAIVGGTASVIGGGKFANGAITGAFSRLYNDDQHQKALFRVDRFGVGGGASMSVWSLTVNGNEFASGGGIEPEGFGGPGFDRVAAGEYELSKGYSNHFRRDLWGVPDAVADGSGRAMDKVWIHSGNTVSDTQGCYIPGAGFSSPGVIAGGTSRPAVIRIDSILSSPYISSRRIQYINGY